MKTLYFKEKTVLHIEVEIQSIRLLYPKVYRPETKCIVCLGNIGDKIPIAAVWLKKEGRSALICNNCIPEEANETI